MWRIWHLNNKNQLKALTNDHVWHKGVNVAIGEMGINYSGGGFYGFDSLSRIEAQESGMYRCWKEGKPTPNNGMYTSAPSAGETYVVIGSMLGFGTALIAPMGARVRNAQPEYLILSGDFTGDVRLMETATLYGMKPITWEQALTLRTGLVPFTKDMILKEDK